MPRAWDGLKTLSMGPRVGAQLASTAFVRCPLHPTAHCQGQNLKSGSSVQQSTCRVLGIVLGAWGCTNVGDTGLVLNKLTAWVGERLTYS